MQLIILSVPLGRYWNSLHPGGGVYSGNIENIRSWFEPFTVSKTFDRDSNPLLYRKHCKFNFSSFTHLQELRNNHLIQKIPAGNVVDSPDEIIQILGPSTSRLCWKHLFLLLFFNKTLPKEAAMRNEIFLYTLFLENDLTVIKKENYTALLRNSLEILSKNRGNFERNELQFRLGLNFWLGLHWLGLKVSPGLWTKFWD